MPIGIGGLGQTGGLGGAASPLGQGPIGGNSTSAYGAGAPAPAQDLQKEGEAAEARLKKINEASNTLGVARKELDRLVKMRDTVSEEDVVEAFGRIVAAGGKPREMAAMLADVPFGNSEALQAWLAKRDVAITQIENQMQVARSLTQHTLGVTALRMLGLQHLSGMMNPAEMGQATPGPEGPQAPNELLGDMVQSPTGGIVDQAVPSAGGPAGPSLASNPLTDM